MGGLSAASGLSRHDSRARFEFVILLKLVTKVIIRRFRSSDQNYVLGFNVCVAPSLVEPSVRISESRSVRRSSERDRETETEIETGTDQSYRSSSDSDSEQRCLIRLPTEVLP